MSMPDDAVAVALDRRFLLDHPDRAAEELQDMSASEAAATLQAQPATVLVPVLLRVTPDIAAGILQRLPTRLALAVLTEMLPNDAVRLLNLLDASDFAGYVDKLDEATRNEIERLMSYPAESAGRLMQTRIPFFRDTASVKETLARLRKARAQATRSLFIVDAHNKLCGRVSIQDLAVAPSDMRLSELTQAITATASPIASRDAVVELLEDHKLVDLAVVDVHGVLLGIIYHAALIKAIQEDATTDIQAMVGASRDERALSTPLFAIRKRLPWLQINLLTAFLAAAVVGIFEETIAQFTALAVLLPVVAGQSGNAGAQALAVTMRGLALREITLRQWAAVTSKEVLVGLTNGIAVALTCGLAVYLWSGSLGLVAVIALSMVLAMVVAGFAGAVVPICLTRVGQDPAQSSSIILTTVTDVAGFFSFLGIATLLASML